MQTTQVTVKSILTRAGGYLRTVCSHSLQPYRGCPFGSALCGVGCYVQHNVWTTGGRAWGDFLDVRTNAAEAYATAYARERAWARRKRGRFAIFLSSASEPFPPQEGRYGVTTSVLRAMLEQPPDELIVQTHAHHVARVGGLLAELASLSDLRVHLSIESDRDRLPGLPPPASSVEHRFAAAAALHERGLAVIITVSPLLPIAEPDRFFARIAEVADAVVIDHYIGGDGTPQGTRTALTALPAAMAAVDPESVSLAYRDRMVDVAQRYLPGRVGTGPDGFARRWLPPRGG